jgi:hypothetical protein
MRVVSRTLKLVAALIMALVVAGFMLAFIDDNSREFFLSILVAPVALIFQGMSAMLDAQRQ